MASCTSVHYPKGMLTHPPMSLTGSPGRRCLCDWASLTSKVKDETELQALLTVTRKTISDSVSTYETKRMRSAGNFLDGEQWERFGAELKWSSETAARLIDANFDGRCVNHVNVTLKGGTGIGSLPLTDSGSLLSELQGLGFSRCPRIDLSIDITNVPELTVRFIANELKVGNWRIPRRSPDDYFFHGPLADSESSKKGSTLYIGSRDSEVQVCVYDKGRREGASFPWIRIEVRYRKEKATEASYRLVQAYDSAMESADPGSHLDHAVVGLVRSAFDVRDVSKYRGTRKLPKNWANDRLTNYPELMSNVFEQTAPIYVGSFKATGAFASRTRHLMHSSGKHLWRLAIISIARGGVPGDVTLTMGAPHAGTISEEDFKDMAQTSGCTIAELEAAEIDAHSQLMKLHGLDVECISSDRSLVREELLRTTGGV